MQSALLEAMQEKQVTIGGTTYKLKSRSWCSRRRTRSSRRAPTRCPRRSSTGSCSRCGSAIPTRDEEREILLRMSSGEPIPVQAGARARRRSSSARQRSPAIHMDQRLVDYIVDLVRATREPATAGLPDLAPLIAFGASPRASIALAQASRAHRVPPGPAPS